MSPTIATASAHYRSIAIFGLLALMSACGTSTGGGGVIIGGAPGSVCDPTVFSQGCSSMTKVTCDSSSMTWTTLGNCGIGETCVPKPDPAAPNTFKRNAVCMTFGAGGTDAGQLGGDAPTQSDANTGGDVAAADAGSGDGSVVQTTDVGLTSVGGAWLTCVAAKCASQWGGCATAAKCKAGALCMDGCGTDKKCRQSCIDSVQNDDQNKLISVVLCAKDTDCKAEKPAPKCGDGTCEAGESAETCPKDCKKAGPKCGDGTCDAGENVETCFVDCKPTCGDGKCEFGESKNTCATDCGPQTDCGNGTCEAGETASSCKSDCGGGGGGGGGGCIEQKCAVELQKCTSNPACLGIVGFGALQNCADTNKCTDNACVASKCKSEFDGCQAGAGCNAILGCLNKCTDQACQQKCIGGIGYTYYETLAKCAQTKCP